MFFVDFHISLKLLITTHLPPDITPNSINASLIRERLKHGQLGTFFSFSLKMVSIWRKRLKYYVLQLLLVLELLA